MRRKLFLAALGAVVVLGLGALSATPAGAGRCKPDPNPNGRDHCFLHCPPCTTLVCVSGNGKCPFMCEPMPGCVLAP